MMEINGFLETAVSAFYWLVVVAWLAVFVLLLNNARLFFSKNPVLSLICIVLAIDAFRTILENIYFGIFFNAYFGWLPRTLLDYGGQPGFVLAIKLLTFASALLMFLLLRRLLPAEQAVAESLADQGRVEAQIAFAKRLEQELESLNMAQTVARIGSWVIDVETMSVTWSDENYRIHGVDAATFRPSRVNIDEYLSAEDAANMRRLLDASLKTGHPAVIEHSLMLGDGSLKHVEQRWRVVMDSGGQAMRVIGTCQDITEHKEAQEKLDRSGGLLRIAGKIAKIGGWSVNAADQKLTWSDEVFDIVEYPVSSQPPLELALALYPPEWRDNLASAMEACMQHGTPFDLELEINTARGNRRDVRCVAQAEKDANGNIIGVQGALQDISEVKNAEKALSESAERLRLLSRASKDAIWDWDRDADTIWGNQGFETLFGYGPEEIAATREASELSIHQEDRARVVSGMRLAFEGTGDTWSDSYRYRRRDGSYAHVDARGSLIRNSEGRVVRVVGGMSDVSAKVQLETQLRQAQRLDSLGQLTGGVAHDFNNLLTVIMGGSESLVEELADDPPRRDVAQMVLEAAARGAELTQHLLAFSRQQPLHPVVLDVNGLITQVEPMLRRTLGEQINIRLNCEAGLWPAHVDSGQLQNALLNLCLNARDAMPNGGLLTIETANTHLDEAYALEQGDVEPGDFVMVAVSDMGSGIPPEVLSRVFEPFFTTKEVGKGTGLGLAMVYGFVKQSDGHIRIYSEPGHGTSVRIYLPRFGDDTDVGMRSPAPSALVGGNEAILLVEDDALVRRYARAQLAHLGYEVIEAENGSQALDVIRSGVPLDLLFTDVVMPGLNGRALADEARALRPELRVLFTSGYAEHAITHQGRLVSGVTLLSKPYPRALLASKVREVLDG